MRLRSTQVHCADEIVDQIYELIDGGTRRPNVQSKYIAEYLCTYLKAGWVIIESDYVDRHFIDEFVGHYATNFRTPPSKTHRLHFFIRGRCPLERIRSAVEQTGSDVGEAACMSEAVSVLESELTPDYLGFVVLRPLPDAPIGRTILRPPSSSSGRTSEDDLAGASDEVRNYLPAKGLHDVHVGGLRLQVEGMPFQQQDEAVGACATTALWSALAATGRRNGRRAPTPLAVTQMATRFSTNTETGLELRQMCHAIRECGYSPVVFRPASVAHAHFQMQLVTYLNSGFPVILDVKDRQGGSSAHAVTVCGFRVGDDYVDPMDLLLEYSRGSEDSSSIDLRMLAPTRYYMHDDNVGPYLRRCFKTSALAQDNPRLVWQPAANAEKWAEGRIVRDYEVRNAVVPLYPKIRFTAELLMECASDWFSLAMTSADETSRAGLRVELGYALSGEYLRECVQRAAITSAHYDEFMDLVLPRYVAVARFYEKNFQAFDLLFDSTTIRKRDALLGVVAYDELPEFVEPRIADLIRQSGSGLPKWVDLRMPA